MNLSAHWDILLHCTMATNVAADALPKPGMTFCKKCSFEHEKPVGNKCERSKQVAKETEKRDSSRESLPVKKTPKGKVGESPDKMLDLVLNTMTNVTEKLSAMDDRITGLASNYQPGNLVRENSPNVEELQTQRKLCLLHQREPHLFKKGELHMRMYFLTPPWQ